MKNIIFLIGLMFISCNSKKETEEICNVTYTTITKESTKHNLYLTENISKIVNENSENKNIKIYDSLTKNYLKYFSEIEKNITKNTSEIFFNGDEYSSKGKEFIKKTKEYKLEIDKLIITENFKKRFNLIINTNDLQQSGILNGISDNNEIGKIEINKLYIKYLDYYFRGLSNNQTLTFLSTKKMNILYLENEYLVEEK